MRPLWILHLAILKPLRHCFDYLLPVDFEADIQTLKPGMRFLVPFGKTTEVVGILLKVDQMPCFDVTKLKPAICLLDTEPLLPNALFSLYQWASQYYQHAIGEVILGTLPAFLRKATLPKAKKKVDSYLSSASPAATASFTLNPDQTAAIQAISTASGFQTFLLDGITGSGKTEVYLQVISRCLQKGQQALVLVPEIGLTPQTIARFAERFSVPIAALHSKLSERERYDAWMGAKKGEIQIVIGTRSAIFTPFSNLGIIILDEEHDASFKQQSGFRYSARDLAIVRGNLEQLPVVLGSATACLETMQNAYLSRFTALKLPQRAGNANLPAFYLIDLRNKPLVHGFAPELLTHMERHLKAGNQVLLFLNRRGYAPALLCHHCGWAAQCKHCDAKLTYHQKPPQLICHHCTKAYKLIKQCLNCGSDEVFHMGLGTERLEYGLQLQFPSTEIMRIDRDTVRTKTSLEEKLDLIQSGHSQILIGTQMLAKGHHFPNVTLVGIIDTDSGLYSTDFRATEHMGQLILQVAGRAGRAEKPGEVFLQTHQPEHPLLQILIQEGYSAYAKALLEERRAAHWPPFSHLVLLRAEARQSKKALDFLLQVHDAAKEIWGQKIEILGPIPAPMERKANHFRALLLLRATQRPLLQSGLATLVSKLDTPGFNKNRVKWMLDVDPLEVF